MSRTTVALVVFALLTAACGESTPPADGAAAAPPPTSVQAIVLAPKPIPHFSEFVATIRSLRSTTVQPQVEGYVREIFVAAGDRVRQGQPLMQIDPDRQQATVGVIESQRAAREADLTLATQELARMQKLYEAGAVSLADFERAQSARTNA